MTKKYENRITLNEEQTELLESIMTGNNTVDLYTSPKLKGGWKIGTFDLVKGEGAGFVKGETQTIVFKIAQYFNKQMKDQL
jgi:hypothetical protein